MPEDWSSILEQDLQKLSEVVGVQPATTEKFIAGERRNVAMLFLDLKGFTALSEKLDHEIVHKLVGGIMKALSSVVKGHVGYVDKIEGDQIMALFGAREATDNDCIRAVACSLKMMSVIGDIRGILTGKGIEINARCGLNYGSVTVAPDAIGHLSAMGDEVNLASRMESTAEINTVQVTASVKEECEEYFEWDDLGESKVKGKKLSIHSFSPKGPGKIQTERWDRAKRVARSPIVGRDTEMQTLLSWWDKISDEVVKNERGSAKHFVVGINGEAGIGKSRLVHEFVKTVNVNDNITVLRGNTLSFAQPTQWLWIPLLKNYFNIEAKDSDAKSRFDRLINSNPQLSNCAAFLSELLSIPNDDPRLQLLDFESKQRELKSAISTLIQFISENSEKTVIILEDLHWMDESSQQILNYILSNCSTDKPLLFLCLYRPQGQYTFPESQNNLNLLEEIKLRPIYEDACRQLIKSMLGRVAIDVEEFLLEHSNGNPFFLEEFVISMIESGYLTEEGTHWCFTVNQSDIPIPATMSRLLHSRIDKLPEAQRRALQYSSVIGMEFLMMLYRRLNEKLDIDSESQNMLIELEKRDFIFGDKGEIDLRYIFKHILTHNTAYETILRHNRKILHRNTAESFLDLFVNDESYYMDIASHYELAEEWDLALEYYAKAGDSYYSSIRYDKALDAYKKTQSICENRFESNHVAMADYKIKLADISYKMGLFKKAESLYKEVIKIREDAFGEQHIDVAECLNNLSVLYGYEGNFDKAYPLSKRALDIRKMILGEDHTLYAESIANRGLLFFGQGKYDEAAPLLVCAIGINEKVWGKDHKIVAKNLSVLAAIFNFQKHYDKAERLFERALHILKNSLPPNHPHVANALNNMGSFYFNRGKYDKAEPFIVKALKIKRLVLGSQHPQVALGLNNLAQLYEAQSFQTKAVSLFEEALVIAHAVFDSNSIYLAKITYNLGKAYMDQGLFDKSESLLKESVDIFIKVAPNHPDLEVCMESLIRLYETNDRIEEAQDVRDRVRELPDK